MVRSMGHTSCTDQETMRYHLVKFIPHGETSHGHQDISPGAWSPRYIMQRQFRPKTPRGEPRDSHGQTLFMCKIKGFYCILVMHIVIFKIETPPLSHILAVSW